MTQAPSETQWIFNLLVNGFDRAPSRRPSERVKAFRQERLKRMVLRAIYDDFVDVDYRTKRDGTRRV